MLKNYFPNIPSFKSSSAGFFPNQIPNNAFLKSKPSIVPFFTPFFNTTTPSPGIFAIKKVTPFLNSFLFILLQYLTWSFVSLGKNLLLNLKYICKRAEQSIP